MVLGSSPSRPISICNVLKQNWPSLIKEMTLLSMILIPKDWTIENRGMSLIVRTPEEAEEVREELERRQKSETSRRLARK